MAARVIFRQDGREAVNVGFVRLKHPLRLSVYLFSCVYMALTCGPRSRIRDESGGDNLATSQMGRKGLEGKVGDGWGGVIGFGSPLKPSRRERRLPKRNNVGVESRNCMAHIRFRIKRSSLPFYYKPDNRQNTASCLGQDSQGLESTRPRPRQTLGPPDGKDYKFRKRTWEPIQDLN